MTDVPQEQDLRRFAKELVALDSRDAQLERLRERGLLTAEGLEALVRTGDWLVDSEPAGAERLAELCAAGAEAANAPEIRPYSNMLRARSMAMTGRPERALGVLDAARGEFETLGDELAALRTELGRIHLLFQMGRHQPALAAARAGIESLDRDSVEVNGDTAVLRGHFYNNLGNCDCGLGGYEQALESYSQAESAFLEAQHEVAIANTRLNRGAALLGVGEATAALGAFEAAAETYESEDRPLGRADALSNAAYAHMMLANYARSLELFEEAREIYRSARADSLTDDHILLNDMAEAYLALNLHSEAQTTYDAAVKVARTAGSAVHVARALWGRGAALAAQGRIDDAQHALDEAQAMLEAAANVPLAVTVRLEQAALHALRGDDDRALTVTRDALAQASEADLPIEQVYAHIRMSDLLFAATSDDAEAHLLEAQRLVRQTPLPPLRQQITQRLGRLRLRQGRRDEARTLLEQAVNDTERVRGRLGQEALRTSYLTGRTAAYEDLVGLYLDEGDADSLDSAFALAERAKSRTLVEMMLGLVETRLSDLTDQRAADRLDALRAELNAIYSQWLGSGGNPERGISLSSLQQRAVELEQEISLLQLRVPRNAGAGSSLKEQVPTRRVRSLLDHDEVLLAYHIVGDEIMAFVSSHETLSVVRSVARVSEVEETLQRLLIHWDRFRAGRGFVEPHLELLEKSALRLLSEQYEQLMAPLMPTIERVCPELGKLSIVPHGILHQVPFHALYDGDQYLLDRCEVVIAPSATVWSLCQERESQGGQRALVMAVSDANIPETVPEAKAIACQFGDVKLRVGEAATRQTLADDSAGCAVVHLACHGVFRADSPMYSTLQLSDGWITAGELAQLDLSGALVTLSACESGRSRVLGGDEIVGLTRACLGAGASTVVVSLWLVQDETTAQLMTSFYRRLSEGYSRAAALRAAQQELRKEHSHPYYWAPFVVVGQR